MKMFDYIIILCPSELIKSFHDSGEYFYEFYNSRYIGGNTRMDAAINIASNTRNFIVVGGSKRKVNGMKSYLLKRIKTTIIPKIIRVESESNTLGNVHAMKIFFNTLNVLSPKKIGILTNYYHMPRVMRLSSDIISKYNITPLIAESLVAVHQEPNKDLYRQIDSEIKGLTEWENESYENQYKVDWKMICYDL